MKQFRGAFLLVYGQYRVSWEKLSVFVLQKLIKSLKASHIFRKILKNFFQQFILGWEWEGLNL